MYHPLTTSQQRSRRQSVLLFAAVLALALLLAVVGVFAARDAVREQSALSMRSAILERAKQCCAVEGVYPRSIEYLEEHYGLVLNTTDFDITYECYADNIVPSVVVVPR